MLYCTTCPSSFHAYCISPPLTEIPEAEGWHCPRCEVQICQEPKNRPEKVLSWRWIEIEYPAAMAEEELKVKILWLFSPFIYWYKC